MRSWGSSKEAKGYAEDGKADEDDREDELREIVDTKRNFLHDVRAFAEAYPEYKRYGDILAQHGIEFDVEEIMNRDMSKADAKLIVASMIAISRSDRWSGHNDDFGRCVENGTFARWAKRLREFV